MKSVGRAKPSVMTPVVVHCLDGDRMLGSRGYGVFESTDHGKSWSKLFDVPAGMSRFLYGSRLARRLMRRGIHHVHPMPNGKIVVVADDFVQAFDPVRGRFLEPTKLVGKRPLALCVASSSCFYGEYRGNAERSPVHIFGSDDGVTWTVRHEFPKARHVHAVNWDPFERVLWITTGDDDNECAIIRSTEDFGSVETVFAGMQQYRAVQLVFTESSIFFGTDAPGEQNQIYRMDRKSRELKAVASVRGPVFFGCQVGDHIFFGTVCEPTDISRNRVATVWGGRANAAQLSPLLYFRKDLWGMRLFQYGQIRFPAGPNPGPLLWLTPFATEFDQKTLAYHIGDLTGHI